MSYGIWRGVSRALFCSAGGDMPSPSVKQPPFASLVGINITHVSPERVAAELTVRDDLTNGNGILHGGAIMTLADNLGGTATMSNLQAGLHYHHDRKQDQFLRRHSARRHGTRRMYAASPRPHHDGLANPHHAR